MSLAVPLGLLGLLTLLVLILIYILKPRYQRQSVSSTYIWKLSLRYVRKKIPLQITSSVLIILQVIILTLIAVMMARPLYYANSVGGEKIVILDASVSMSAQQNGQTRFARAVNEIADLAEVITRTDRFTVILAKEEADILVNREDNADLVKQALLGATYTYQQGDIEGAIELAKSVLDVNPDAEIILFTARDYPDSGGITVRNISAGEWNAAILDFTVERTRDNYYLFTAVVASYNRNMELPVMLHVDGVFQTVIIANCSGGRPVTVPFDSVQVISYETAEVFLNLETDDSLLHDNRFYLFGGGEKQFEVQLVSASPLFLRAALQSLGSKVTVPSLIDPDQEPPYAITDLDAATEGYDLYIYDGIMPSVMPTDGAVWLINPDFVPSGAGFTLGNEFTGNFSFTSVSSPSAAHGIIMNMVTPSNITASKYRHVTGYAGYEAMMLRVQDPVLLAKEENGKKTVVLAFDLQFSNLSMLIDFPILINNLFRYSLLETIEHNIFVTGSNIVLNSRPTAISFTLTGGQYIEEELTPRVPFNMSATHPGVYTVKQVLDNNQTVIEENFFVRIPRFESDFSQNGGAISAPVGDGPGNVNDETMARELFLWLAIACMVIFYVERWLQFREQF